MTAVADLKMTPARISLLRAIADPDTEVYASAAIGGSWSTADVWIKDPYGTRRKVTKKVGELEAAELVKRANPGIRYHTPRHYTLTEAGARALAEPDKKEPGRD